MTRSLRHTALLVALSLGVGCQNMRELTGFSTSNSPPVTSTLPGVPTTPLDGTGPAQMSELPTRKKVELLLVAAKHMEEKGSIPEAISHYEQVRELDPHRDLACSRHLAVLYDRKGEFTKATDEYEKLLKANPKDADAHNDLGYGYYQRAKFEAAEKCLREAVHCDPKHKRGWTNLGMTLAQLGKYEEALAAFEKTVNKSQAYCNVGCIQFAQGKRMEARDSFSMAVKLEPGLEKAHAALARINDGPRSQKDRERNEAARRHEAMLKGVDREAGRNLPFVPQGMVASESDMIASITDMPVQGMSAIAPPTASPTLATLPTLPQALPPISSTPLTVD